MNCEICFTQWDSPCGRLMLASIGNKLVMNDWLEGWHHEAIMKRFNRLLNAPSWTQKTTPVISQAINQLEAYFHGQPNSFNLDIDLIGTEFQLNVWRALQTIPYGKLVSYKDIAQSIGNPRAIRAVGGAVGQNPISIIVPCHRVVGADRALTGYGGGYEAKQFLLNLENDSLIF